MTVIIEKKAILALSGGLDSTTLLALLLNQGYKVKAVGFNYGSKHGYLEMKAADAVCDFYQIPFRQINISPFMYELRSSLMRTSRDEIPKGHYEAESMKSTVVPGRNLIFTSILAAMAESEGYGEVYLGVHAGDHAIYHDCRPEFIYSLQNTISFSTDQKVNVVAPFLLQDKAAIVKIGLALKAPYHFTRTCYTNKEIACGECGSCQERLCAFQANGVEDPIPYIKRDILPKPEAK